MNALSDIVEGANPNAAFDLENAFRAHYRRVARLIGRVVHNQARAEELAVEVFLKLWRNPQAHGKAEGWLYRTAVRQGLDELRRQERQTRYNRLLPFGKRVPTPEELHRDSQNRERVRSVLAAMESRQAELLLLRSHGLSYEELAAALNLNRASVGTFLSRAQQTFRKEFTQRYGQQS